MKLPSQATLDKYGLEIDDWLLFAGIIALNLRPGDEIDDMPCRICEKVKDKFVVDHEHVYGWPMMEPEKRRQYVRGVVCTGCNWRVLHRQISALKHENAAIYLREYERRRPK